jgi:FkbM family methyltransferase
MKRKIKSIIKQSIRKLGFDLVKTNRHETKMPFLKNRLTNLIKLGFESSIIVDGGAHIGNWTKTVSKFFPNSKFILIEPNPLVYSKIKKNLPNNLEYTVMDKALGAEKGYLELNLWEGIDSDLTGSSLCEHVRGEATKKIKCEIIQLDSIIDIYRQVPNLVKLDLQGYEINALQGAKEALKKSEIMIIEFGCLDAYVGRTSINDLIKMMYDNSYCLYDIIDIDYRPYDNALTGGDFIFVKKSSRLREYKGWE